MGNFYHLLFENDLFLSFEMCQVLEGRVLFSEKTKEKGGGGRPAGPVYWVKLWKGRRRADM